MSKLIVRGNPAGEGSVTLRPPVLETDIEMELPTSGTHLSGANAEGMPQLNDGTPVVESGSNTDGEWTRWAEGTQQCISAAHQVNYAVVPHTYPFPMPFSDRPGNQNVISSAGSPGLADLEAIGLSVPVVNSATQWEVFCRVRTSGTDEVYYSALGRWK